jgi:hypothetical protein
MKMGDGSVCPGRIPSSAALEIALIYGRVAFENFPNETWRLLTAIPDFPDILPAKPAPFP